MKTKILNKLRKGAWPSIALIASMQAASVWAFDEAPNTVQFTLEGCRNDGNPTLIPGSNTLPNTDGNFTCQDPAPLGGNDTPYTTGNLGKGWNELDYVPHRLTTTNNKNGGTVTYNVLIAADNADSNGIEGYDEIFDVQLITAPDTQNVFSDSSCVLVVGNQQIDTSGTVTGGIEDVIYRELTITQAADTTCVIDWANRLAIGASSFPGSSLQSYMFESEDFQKGKRTVSIPVKDIVEAGIRKTMTASSGEGIIWNVNKTVNPVKLDLGNTCDQQVDNSGEVKVTVEWSVIPSSADSVKVVTNIFVSNAASRDVLADITDEIFGNIDDGNGKKSLDVETFNNVLVPANSEVFVTHTYDIDAAPEDVSELSDKASAIIKDPAKPGNPTFSNQPIEVEFDLGDQIQIINDTSTTAVITETEKITGAALKYAVTDVSGATGTFQGGYNLDTELDAADDNLVWVSDNQNPVICNQDSGCVVDSIEFTKTVSVADGEIVAATGSLDDWVTLLASDGSSATSGTEQSPISVDVTSTALVDLDVQLIIPELDSGTLACTVEVTNTGDFSQELIYNFTTSVNDLTKTLENLEPDMYTATVKSCGDFIGDMMGSVTFDLSSEPTIEDCSDKIVLELEEPEEPSDPAFAAVDKVTFPAGSEDGWQMVLIGPNTGTDGIVLTTSDGTPDQYETFQGDSSDFKLTTGENYTITEVSREGWVQTGSNNCTFDVELPRDSGKTFQCQFTNKKLGKIIINKKTKPKYGSGFSFMQDIDDSGSFTLDHGQSKVFYDVEPGSYKVEEIDPGPDFFLKQLVCTESVTENSQISVPNRVVDIELDPGETVECTYTNIEKGMVVIKKHTNGYPTDDKWLFTLYGPEVNTHAMTPPSQLDFGVKLIPNKVYKVCEIDIPKGWLPIWLVDSDKDGYPDERLDLEITSADSPIIKWLGTSKVFNPYYGKGYDNDGYQKFCVNFKVKPGQTLHFKVDNLNHGKDDKGYKESEPKEDCYDTSKYGDFGSYHMEPSDYWSGSKFSGGCER
ncbi:hypothetical protein [Photobacterium sp. DNB22_13_2]